MQNIILVTGNKDKVEEYCRILDVTLQHRDIDLPEIQSLDIEEVATAKARQAYAVIKQPVVVEDTALVFHGLGKLPGTFIKWFTEELGYSGLCQLLRGKEDRSATAYACIALYDGNEMHTFIGESEGTITDTPHKGLGFGFDCIFMPHGYKTTWSEMNREEKDTMSHRSRAVMKLQEFLSL